MIVLQLPERFEKKLKDDPNNFSIITDIMARFGQIYIENNLYFFEEYTDHGWRHINDVLKASDEIITDESFSILNSNDILLLVASIFLHDLGMHIQLPAFKKLIGSNNAICKNFDKSSWSQLWKEYLVEAMKFSSKKRYEIFGNENVEIKAIDINKKDDLSGTDKKLIGEFIRRHHPRLAHEIALNGLETDEGRINFFKNNIEPDLKDLAGLLARSHGIEIRSTFDYLKEKYPGGWKKPYNSKIFFLMVVLRMADYFQIDSKRVLKVPFQTKAFKSPVSFTEHKKHLQTKYAQTYQDDSETLYIHAEPMNSTYFVALNKLFKDMQKELDMSWAVLGEIYGNQKIESQLRICYRRILSNINETEAFTKTVNYVPSAVSFTVNNEIPKLLISPLYGDDPSYGVRELIQNAVDACLERERLEQNNLYSALIEIEIYQNESDYFFSITDNGKGMTFEEIKNYFLTIGGSLRKSADWYKKFVGSDNKATVRRSGRFGIGILSSYLLGESIEVQTKSYSSDMGYKFETNLEQEQIEITKDFNLETGTKIIISISESIFTKLVEEENDYEDDEFHEDYSSWEEKIKFYGWFKLTYPKVLYKMNGKKIRGSEKIY